MPRWERIALKVGARDRVVVGIAEEEPAEPVDDPIPELCLSQASGGRAWCRRGRRGRVRGQGAGHDRAGDGRRRDRANRRDSAEPQERVPCAIVLGHTVCSLAYFATNDRIELTFMLASITQISLT